MKKNWFQNNYENRRFDLATSAYRLLAFCVVVFFLFATWMMVIELIKILF